MIKVYSSTGIYIQMLSCILLISFLPVLREGVPHLADFIPTTLSLEGKDRLKCCRRRKGNDGGGRRGKLGEMKEKESHIESTPYFFIYFS